MTTPALDQIQALELQIRQLKEDAILELKEKPIAARRAVSDLEMEIEALTGHAAPTGAIRIRREIVGYRVARKLPSKTMIC